MPRVNLATRKEYTRAHYLSHREQILAKTKAYYRTHRDEIRVRNRPAVVTSNRLARTGWTKERYAQVLLEQGGRCAICRLKFTRRAPCADHNHKTKTTRGLLCHNCNSALGLLRESRETLLAAADYLAAHNSFEPIEEQPFDPDKVGESESPF